jgi:hypothetical protein
MDFKIILMALLGIGLTYDGIRQLRLRSLGRNQKVFRNVCQAAVGITVLVFVFLEISKP